jgi:RNA polymerase sigma-70 factor (ECF subfamily)
MAVPADTSPITLPGRDGVRAFRASDREAVDELFAAHYPRLAGWVRRMVRDEEIAHEIASEAFTRLMSRWSRLDNPHAYLYRIATNLVRDHWRRTERERRAMRTYANGRRADISEADIPADLRELVDTLPERQRDAFLLHYYAGYPVREVAGLLHRPEGTVKSDLYQARHTLRAALDGSHE